MPDFDPTATVLNSYSTVKMPDGQEVLMQKLAGGAWVTVSERLEQSITERFAHTDMKPHDWKEKSGTDNVTLKQEKRNIDHFIKMGSTTHKHLHAHLIEIIGSPERILEIGKLDNPIKDPSIRRNVVKMIEALNCSPWNEVLVILNKA